MKTVSTTEAKTKLNALLVEVAAGESITITSRGRPIAVLSKVEPPARTFGQFAGLITIGDDFDTAMTPEELADWGESE
ncbi:MAG: type II toxin-antitoxin system prevent-host-death family antitoxin [Micropruina sp.]|uniref:type II toxin-antitoxin system Phd/YefM family antitoxin n=1 Tax=Micropruina sp. TaxID=2737536 RepID=UPI0039E4E417